MRAGLTLTGYCVVVLTIGLTATRVARRNEVPKGAILPRPLRVGIVSWPGYAGGIVANEGLRHSRASTYWKEHHLLVDFVVLNDLKASEEAFLLGGDGGGVDVVWSTVDAFAGQYPRFLSHKLKAKAIMQVDWSQGGDAMVAGADFRKVEDLKGKRIALSSAPLVGLITPSQWFLEFSLEYSALSEEEKADIRNRLSFHDSVEGARNEFLQGKADAAVLWEPDVTHALQRSGSHRLKDTATAARLIADILITREDFLLNHRGAIEALVRGWLQGSLRAKARPDLVARLLQESEELGFRGSGDELTTAMLQEVRLATPDDNADMFGLIDGVAQFDQIFAQAQALWLKRGFIRNEVSAKDVRDATFVETTFKGLKGPDKPCERGIQTAKIRVSFTPRSTTLDAASRNLLDQQLSSLIKTHPNASFCVQGSTDEGSNALANGSISDARAKSIADYLRQRYQRSFYLPVHINFSNPDTLQEAVGYAFVGVVPSEVR